MHNAVYWQLLLKHNQDSVAYLAWSTPLCEDIDDEQLVARLRQHGIKVYSHEVHHLQMD